MKNCTAKPWILLLALLPFICHAQNPTDNRSPKREFRGVWVATVLNIDYPISPNSNADELRRQWMRIIEFYKSLNFNAIVVQIRPSADAIYPSQLAPWSRYLTGKQGTPPTEGFDPLAFMVKTAHDAGMELHAWLNPYRASMDSESPSQMHELHVLRQHPEWCIRYNKRWLMNPGLPEVREHIAQVVEEIVRNYEVDAIHFDDYFYPYKAQGETLNDLEAYAKYQNGFTNLDDWRRNNVDMLIELLSKRIKAIRSTCQFGISPFGIWRNRTRDPEGSETFGLSCYDDLYADVRKWLRNGWIDYVAPQLYWTQGFSTADHTTLANWWNDNAFGKQVYIGHAIYRVGTSNAREPNWGDVQEIPRQISLARSLKNVKGSIHFSSKNLMRNPLGISDLLKNEWYNYPAFPPIVFKDTSRLLCESPQLRKIEADGNDIAIRWQAANQDCQTKPFEYVIYRFDGNRVDFEDGRNILAVVPGDAKNLEYKDKKAVDGYIYTYSVTVVNCFHAEMPKPDLQTVHKVVVTNEKGDKKTKIDKLKSVEYPDGQKPKRKSFWKRLFGL